MKTKSVEVQLPVVRLRVQDLSYLKYLAESPEKLTCIPTDSQSSRLRILGLVEDIELDPCPKAVAEFRQLQAETEKKLRACMSKRPIDWDAINNIPTYGCRSSRAPQKRKKTQVTKAGLKLLAQGTSQVNVLAACK